MKVFNAFHEKLQDAIKRSPEWAKATGQERMSEPPPFDDEPGADSEPCPF